MEENKGSYKKTKNNKQILYKQQQKPTNNINNHGFSMN